MKAGYLVTSRHRAEWEPWWLLPRESARRVGVPCYHVSYPRLSTLARVSSGHVSGVGTGMCSENFSFWGKKLVLVCEYVFALTPGVGCGAASDGPQLLTMICLVLCQGLILPVKHSSRLEFWELLREYINDRALAGVAAALPPAAGLHCCCVCCFAGGDKQMGKAALAPIIRK